jgi:hypothetical protein
MTMTKGKIKEYTLRKFPEVSQKCMGLPELPEVREVF